jgi:hypothetical protein
MIVDFGKYKGKNIGEVPTQYLAWGAVYLSNRWRDVFEQEYDSRLHRELYKFQVFLNTTEPEECLSHSTGLTALSTHLQEVLGKQEDSLHRE